MLAGHPQLPVYAMGVAGLYGLWRAGLSRAFRLWSLMVLGVGTAAFALVPMAMLISRSTRVLALAPPPNDLSMPYGRLAAFFFPWRDGAPAPLGQAALNAFHGYPIPAYFWDTVCYAGLLPWIALVALCCFGAGANRNRNEIQIALFTVAIGLIGILLSLPFMHEATARIPGTILRSPARLIYLTEFALAMALGAGVHIVVSTIRSRVSRVVVALLLVIHLIDLAGHDHQFILRGSLSVPPAESEIITRILKKIGDDRAAIDYALNLPVTARSTTSGFSIRLCSLVSTE